MPEDHSRHRHGSAKNCENYSLAPGDNSDASLLLPYARNNNLIHCLSRFAANLGKMFVLIDLLPEQFKSLHPSGQLLLKFCQEYGGLAKTSC